jgi:hypothetical protein
MKTNGSVTQETTTHTTFNRWRQTLSLRERVARFIKAEVFALGPLAALCQGSRRLE